MNKSRVQLLPSSYYNPIVVIYCFIGMSAVFLNGSALVVFLRNTHLLRRPNLILLSMTVCDLMVNVLATPVGAYANAKRWWTLDPSVCNYYGFMTTWLSLNSILHITALAAERWMTIKLKQPSSRSGRTLFIVLCGLWWFALIWSVLPLFGWSSYGPESGFAGCSITWYSRTLAPKVYIAGTFILFFFVPISIIVSSFIKTYLEINRLIQKAAQRWGTEAQQTKRSLKAKIKAARMSVIMTLAFFIAWTPYAVVSMKAVFTPYHGPPLLSVAAALFAKMSSWYNPIIYFFWYSKFRTATLTLVQLRRKSSAGSQITSKRTGET